MSSFSIRFSPRAIGSVAVLLSAAMPVASRAQEPAPAAPPVSPADPIAPAAPAAPPVPAAVAAPVLIAPPVNPAAPNAAEMSRARAAYLQAVEAMNRARDAMNREMRKQTGANGPTIRSFSIPGSATAYFNGLRGTSLPNQTVSINLKNTPARDAIIKILGDAKLGYILDDDISRDARVTLSVDGVQVSTALDLVTQSAGVRWSAERRDGKIIVYVGKRVAGSASAWTFDSNTLFTSPASRSALDALNASRVMTIPNLRNSGVLPLEKVSLDVRDTSARKILSDMLDKQKIGYEFANDFPKDDKVAVRFDDLNFSDALDRVARSVGVKWRVEKRGDKTVVRFGKTVVPDLFNFYNGTAGLDPFTALKGLTVPGSALSMERAGSGAPMIYQYRTSEQRSTFTCPKCGKQTTIVQKADAKPGDAKDKHNDAWHYCPYCGKKVADSGADHFAPVWESNADLPAPAAPFQWTRAYGEPNALTPSPSRGESLQRDFNLSR